MKIVLIIFGTICQHLLPQQEEIYSCARKADSNFPDDIHLPINMTIPTTGKDIST